MQSLTRFPSACARVCGKFIPLPAFAQRIRCERRKLQADLPLHPRRTVNFDLSTGLGGVIARCRWRGGDCRRNGSRRRRFDLQQVVASDLKTFRFASILSYFPPLIHPESIRLPTPRFSIVRLSNVRKTNSLFDLRTARNLIR